MSDYLQRALIKLDATEGDVLAHGLSADGLEYAVVLDKGIKGCPKYRIPLVDLPDSAPKETAVIPTEDSQPDNAPEAAPLEDDEPETLPESEPPLVEWLEDASYSELQSEAKAAGIPANQSKDVLKAALLEYADANL
jgi:hypothetical protein